jgi:hypothetical protein
MKEFALVYSQSKVWVVTYYADWIEYPFGCVMQTSDNLDELEREANWRNEEIADLMEG